MNKLLTIFTRKTALTVAGLAFTGGVIGGPIAGITTAHAAPAITASQSTISLTPEQADNAKKIVATTKKQGLDQRAATIAVATSLQESKLENLGHLGDANDHDSLGLFQQRPSSGWGTPEQITNPEYATTAFLTGLKQVDGWHDMPVTVAAQKVQVSAYPDAYAQWEKQATDIVNQYWNK